MSLTDRQLHILTRLPELKLRIRQTGMQGYDLEGDDVSSTINSMLVNKLVVKENYGRRIVMTEGGRNALGTFTI